jgi:hypothetical protein
MAAARWGADTAIATEASPISTRPMRCTIATREMSNRSIDVATIFSSSRSAMGA